MIKLDELKPILEELLDGREDGADYIERVQELDHDIEFDRSEIDRINAEWNDRFKKAFFGEKGDDIKVEVETEETKDEEEKDGEDLTYEDLFTEVKEKEED